MIVCFLAFLALIFFFNYCIFIISTQDQPENHLRVRLPPAKYVIYYYYNDKSTRPHLL